ncbi:MAG: FkbM family methyltransferase [Lacunisphaera sp.]|nr:FkbM family methyltransferase [Lacunisphaera sp.]
MLSLLSRLQRKARDVRRFPALAAGPADRRDLWLLGLVHNRVLSPAFAARFTTTGRDIAPRLAATRGERVRVELDHSGQIDCFNELFFEGIYDLAAVGFAPDLVADCGGYCGYFSTMAAGFFPAAALHCFEANPDNLPMLRAQLAALSRPVELHPAAVFLHDGTITFSGAGVGGAVTGADTAGARTIPSLDFPRWLHDRAPQRFVWKLDVEGAEKELLPACLGFLPRPTVIFLETHHPDGICAALLAPYRDAGFSLREIRRRPAGGFDYIEWVLQRA